MTIDPKDALIYELVEMYKGALRSAREWQEVATIYTQGHNEGLLLETARLKHRPFLRALFGEFDQARERGLPAEEALRLLLAKLRQSVH